MTPSDITSTPVDHLGPSPPGVRPLRWFLVDHSPIPQDRRHRSPGSSSKVPRAVARRQLHVGELTALGSIGRRTDNCGCCAIGNGSGSIHRSKRLRRPSPNRFSAYAKAIPRRWDHRAHMSRANQPRPVLIVVGPKGVAFVPPCLSSSLSLSLSSALSLSLSLPLFLSLALS